MHCFKFCKKKQLSFYLKINFLPVSCFASVPCLPSQYLMLLAPNYLLLVLVFRVVFCCSWNIAAAYLLSPFSSLFYTSPLEKHPLLFSVCSVFPECVLFLLSITQDRSTIAVVNYNKELQGNTSHLLGIDKLHYINSCWYL